MLRFTFILVLLWMPSFVMGIDNLDNFFAWRHQLIIITGVLGLGYMCFAALLAARFSWVEAKVRGLDKGYALHKRLGIGALVALVAHWLAAHSARWLIEAELVAMPNRHKPVIEGINWHSIAEQVGDISFKLFLIFTIISLVQAISYKRFRFTHKIAGILVFAGVFHSLLLLDLNIQSSPLNIFIAVISIVAVYCSWLSLTGKIGKKNQSVGEVVAVEQFSPKTDQKMAARFAIQLDSPIRYKEGQFAYLNFHDGESAHPFSILNYDVKSKQIVFAVKDLGDYTHKLVNHLKVEQKVSVEGGYGCFQISSFKHQVWVGAGIGIVPFISRLYWLKANAAKQLKNIQKIHLFYCINSQKEAFFISEIGTILSHLECVELYILNADKGELLDAETITQKMGVQPFDVSFCGPQSFAQKLKTTLKSKGLPENQFHTELFNMR